MKRKSPGLELKTQSLIEEHLPSPLATIVHYYMLPYGCWPVELMPTGNIDWDFYAACREGHGELIELLLQAGAKEYESLEHGLRAACRGGHIEIINMMASLGANDWTNALRGACDGGHKEIARLTLKRGAFVDSRAIAYATVLNRSDIAMMLQKHRERSYSTKG